MKSELYYGNGDCTIVGTEIRAVDIRFRGAIEITKTANDNFAITQQGNGVMIFPIGEGFLSDLFSYVGEFKIISAEFVNSNLESALCSIKKVMDYAELLDSNAEDLTVLTEDLNVGHLYGKRIDKTKVINNYIKNQHSGGELYFEDGTPYSGAYHVHVDTGRAMTGGEYTEESQDLYIKKIKDGRIVKTAVGEIDKIQKRELTRALTRIKTPVRRYDDKDGGGGGDPGAGGGGY